MKKSLITKTTFLMAILLLGALACGPAAQPDAPTQIPATEAPRVRSNSPFQIPATLVPGFQPDAPVSGPDTQTPQAQPDTSAPSQPEMVETPAPIDGVKLVVSEDDPPQYGLEIVSGLPSGCVKLGAYSVSREENTIHVTVTNLMPGGLHHDLRHF